MHSNGSPAGAPQPASPPEDARPALLAHAAARGSHIRATHGDGLDYPTVLRVLADPEAVRFPVTVVYDTTRLESHQLAYPVANTRNLADGFTLYLHTGLRDRPDGAVAAILYALVAVNYGAAADGEVGEVFGAAALGMDREEYYDYICSVADSVGR